MRSLREDSATLRTKVSKDFTLGVWMIARVVLYAPTVGL